MATIVLLVVLVIVVLWVIGAYNRLIALKNQVANAWKQIDVQLKRRHDLIPNLLGAVKGAMNFERETLEAVVAARNQAIQVSSGGDVSKIAASEGQLTGALHRLLAVVESYPDLKATTNIGQLRETSLATGAAASQVLTSSTELEQQAAMLNSQVQDFLSHVRAA